MREGTATSAIYVLICFSLTRALGSNITTTSPWNDPLQRSTPDRGPASLYNHQGATIPVTARAGQTAVLACTVERLGDRQVSWIRARDLHVLASGSVTFSSDSRVSSSWDDGSWFLHIRFVRPGDSGLYSCQVNSYPTSVTWYNLTVIDVRASILGKKTMYVQTGSQVRLECVIREQLLIPGLVLWYRNDRLVTRDSPRVTVSTQVTDLTRSTLALAPAMPNDSGNYSCCPSSGTSDSVVIHVIQGDPPAAMQHNSALGGNRFLMLLLPWSLTWSLLHLT